MLVVSRKQNQSVVFPSLGIRVEILRTGGKAVRVGIEAPNAIPILRGELADSAWTEIDSSKATSKEEHELRNRLNRANLAMQLLQKQLAAGRVNDAEESLTIALQAYDQMEKAVASSDAAPEDSCFDAGVSDAGVSDAGVSDAGVSGVRKRALLVEDDPNERMLLASYLRASGYDVDTAEDGQAALDYLADHKPDAVVMDIEMPRLSGIECVKEIRNDYDVDEMKLFVVSGMNQKAANVPSGDQGVQRWFQKPLSPEDLVNELESSLN